MIPNFTNNVSESNYELWETVGSGSELLEPSTTVENEPPKGHFLADSTINLGAKGNVYINYIHLMVSIHTYKSTEYDSSFVLCPN